MNLTGFAIGNQRFTALIVITLAVAGTLLFLNFPSRSDPNVTVREAVIVAYYPGMAPGRVENLITRKLERKIRQIPEIKTIKSDSKTGVAIVHAVVYDKFFEMKPIWQDLRNKMAQVRDELPAGTFGPLVDTDFGDVAVATIALTSEGFSFEQMRKVARDITNELYTVPGTRRVVMSGVQQERIFIETTNARLARYGLSPETLLATLQAQNIILPGGKVNVAGYEVVIQPSGNFDSVEDIGNTVVKLPGSEQVTYLRDLMEIRRAYDTPPEEVALYNGRPAIMIAVSMQKKGTNVLEFGPLLKQKVAEIESELPVGYSVDFATYQATYVEQSVSGVLNNVYETIAIVLVMIMLFLGWRTGLIVGSLVPLTMLITLVFMRALDIEFQRVSLATMIIALGLLVDNGIVIAEDITRRLSEGAERRAAALATGRQLAMPLLTSSLTTVLAFMPLMLASDSSGEYMRSMSLVILLSLMVSWGVAMCFTPLLCIWFMPKPKKTAGRGQGGVRQAAVPGLPRVHRRDGAGEICGRGGNGRHDRRKLLSPGPCAAAVLPGVRPQSVSGLCRPAVRRDNRGDAGDHDQVHRLARQPGHQSEGDPIRGLCRLWRTALLRVAGAAGLSVQYRLRTGDG